MHVISNHCNFRKQKQRSASPSCTCLSGTVCWGWRERLNWYLLGGEFPLLKKSTNWNNIDSGEKISVCWNKKNNIIIPRCGDLYFHLLLQYWFIRNIVAFKITTFVCGYLFEMMSKYCITFYVHYLLVVDWSPFNVLCMYSCQVTFTQIWKKWLLKRQRWELILKSIIVC